MCTLFLQKKKVSFGIFIMFSRQYTVHLLLSSPGLPVQHICMIDRLGPKNPRDFCPGLCACLLYTLQLNGGSFARPPVGFSTTRDIWMVTSVSQNSISCQIFKSFSKDKQLRYFFSFFIFSFCFGKCWKKEIHFRLAYLNC